MSGGLFEYQQNRIEDIASTVDELIASNDSTKKDAWDQEIGSHYPEDIIKKFKLTAHTLRQAAEMAQRVDWLESGDDGEDSFRERWGKEVRKDFQEEERGIPYSLPGWICPVCGRGNGPSLTTCPCVPPPPRIVTC